MTQWLKLLSGSVGVLLWSVLGCASDTTGPAQIPPAQLYYQLTLDQHAITLALTPPYDTVTLVATARAATGDSLPGGNTVYTVAARGGFPDTNVTVSANGILRAIAPDAEVFVIARQTRGQVTLEDTALVMVNPVNPVPRPATLTLQANPYIFGFLPSYELNGVIQFVPSVVDSQGVTLSNVAISEASATPTILVLTEGVKTWWTGELSAPFVRGPAAPGHARVVATATVYGVRLTGTLPFVVGWQRHTVVDIVPHVPAGSRTPLGVFTPLDDTIAAGGVVYWRNDLPGYDSVDVVFDDPAAAQAVDSASNLDGFAQNFSGGAGWVIPQQGGGNIPPFAPVDTTLGNDTLGVRARSFSAVGAYPYHSVRYGTRGVIHVLPEFQVP